MKCFVFCFGIDLSCGRTCVSTLSCLYIVLFTANSLLDRNENGLVGYGFEKSSCRLGLGLGLGLDGQW